MNKKDCKHASNTELHELKIFNLLDNRLSLLKCDRCNHIYIGRIDRIWMDTQATTVSITPTIVSTGTTAIGSFSSGTE